MIVTYKRNFLRKIGMIIIVLFPLLVSQNLEAQHRIYIDSVPEGAQVTLRKLNNQDTVLGRTPLQVVVADEQIELIVSMFIRDFVSIVKDIPELKAWSDIAKEAVQGDYFSASDFFDFGVMEYIVKRSLNNEILSIGPTHKLDLRKDNNRLCVVFLPRGKQLSVLFPIMPPVGSYKLFQGLEKNWRQILLEEYEFSSEQTKEAIESFSRIGKSVTIVKDKKKEGREKFRAITWPVSPTETVDYFSMSRPIEKGLEDIINQIRNN